MLPPMLNSKKAVESMVRYMASHPEEVTRFIRSGLGMRVGVPLAAFRWLLNEVAKDAGMNPELDADPPGLRFAATLDKMGTQFRVNASLFINQVQIDENHLRVEMRIDNLKLKVLSEEKTQLSALIKSGALDLSNPGDLVSELPGIPSMVVLAEGNKIAIDIMRSPRLIANRRAREVVGLLSSLVTVNNIESDTGHLDVVFRALPQGPVHAGRTVSRTLVNPVTRRIGKFASRITRRFPTQRLLGGGN